MDTDLFSGISPRGAAGVIVSTLNQSSKGQVPLTSEQELMSAIKRYALPQLRTRSARTFEAIRSRMAGLARGDNGGHFGQILKELTECGFTHPRIKSIPFETIARHFPEASRILARQFPILSSGGLVLIIAKDKSGHWRLFS